MWVKDLLKAGIRWWVGNVDSIYVYRDKWVPRPSTFTVISPPKLDVNTKASQLIMPSGGLNLQLLKYKFSACDVNDIIKIPTGKRDKKDDIIWQYDGKGTLGNIAEVSNWSQTFLDDYISANKKTGNSQNPRCNTGNNMWQPPEKGFYKVNCDALVDRVDGRNDSCFNSNTFVEVKRIHEKILKLGFDKEQITNVVGEPSFADRGRKPKFVMEFDSEETSYKFYNEYAGKMGFSIRKKVVAKNKRTGEEVHNHALVTQDCAHMLPSQRKIASSQAIELELEQDIKNYLLSKRQRQLAFGEAGSLLKYFQKQVLENPSFFHAEHLDNEEQITDIF
ncbi:hypothetical protein Ddye_009113 [Dipteronia dyeriana]|uniref:Uncharacterized protein n=1 Tax=Dipteronia dyeriana TaxID=168575 RepID=A0AAD9XBD4_9ROSI|nr:hypothetical protein Ddye_009113 [Dipteronia dyeriana]